MTPTEKLHHNQRVWTPRLLSANAVLGAGGIVLWFFVSNWITDIKSSVSTVQVTLDSMKTSQSLVMSEYEGRFAKIETRLDSHDMRLAKLER